jgi:hypothetical protein
MICREGWRAEAIRDGRLTPEESECFAIHARTCTSCLVERLRLERITQMLRRLPVRPPSDFVVLATRRRLLETVADLEN